jgi:hypothetical protein
MSQVSSRLPLALRRSLPLERKVYCPIRGKCASFGLVRRTAHYALLEMPDRSEQSPYTCMLPEHKSVRRGAT